MHTCNYNDNGKTKMYHTMKQILGSIVRRPQAAVR